MNLSKHANVRRQQRSIPLLLIDLLLQFGSRVRGVDGTSKMFFDKAAYRRLRAYAGYLAAMFVQYLDLYIVVAADNTVITVAHRLERIRRN